jgi:hypothetical protein
VKGLLALLLAFALIAPGQSSAAPAFHGRAERIDPELRQRMTGVSWHRGCPVGFAGLRLLSVSH